jgi:hypothetical protein
MSRSYSALRVILAGFFRDRVDVFAVQRFDSLDAAVAKVRSGDLPAVVAQQGDTVLLRYAASDQVASATIRASSARRSPRPTSTPHPAVARTGMDSGRRPCRRQPGHRPGTGRAIRRGGGDPTVRAAPLRPDVSQLPPWLRTASNALALTFATTRLFRWDDV